MGYVFVLPVYTIPLGQSVSQIASADLANEREKSASPVQYLAPTYSLGIGVPGASDRDRDLVASPHSYF
jgi:hypothetical protein